jgi:hypothetical protein
MESGYCGLRVDEEDCDDEDALLPLRLCTGTYRADIDRANRE